MKKCALGIDIGGTNSAFSLVDREGNCLINGSIKTNQYDKPQDFVNELSNELSSLIKSSTIKTEIIGVGIGAPNGNYFNGTIEFAPNLKWNGIIPLAQMFSEKFKIPSVLTNDANAAAIGEMIYGGAKKMKDFIVITLGTGLGSGIVVNGDLVYGNDGFAGELGHTIMNPEGRLCKCGRKGCLETYASASGITRTVIEYLENQKTESVLRNYSLEKINSKVIYEAALAGDKIALDAFDYTGKILGLRLSDAVAVTSPEAIFLFGGLALAGDLILKPVKYYMEYYMLPIFKNKVKILHSHLSDNIAAVLGAASLIWKEIEK